MEAASSPILPTNFYGHPDRNFPEIRLAHPPGLVYARIIERWGPIGAQGKALWVARVSDLLHLSASALSRATCVGRSGGASTAATSPPWRCGHSLPVPRFWPRHRLAPPQLHHHPELRAPPGRPPVGPARGVHRLGDRVPTRMWGSPEPERPLLPKSSESLSDAARRGSRRCHAS